MLWGTPTSRQRRPRYFLQYCADGFLMLLFIGISLYGAARLSLAPRDPSAGVAVLFAPWVSEDESLARSVAAGGRFVRHGGYPFIAIVQPDASDYAHRAFAAGALLIADPLALAACLRLLPASVRS
jgi:hypothetical protein